MDTTIRDDFECSTPKLCLTKVPSLMMSRAASNREAHHLIRMTMIVTPPIGTSAASVPFHWEEAPGKPRTEFIHSSSNTSAARRCLQLPPAARLPAAAPSSSSSSPTSVLQEPCLSDVSSSDHNSSRSLRSSSQPPRLVPSFSFRKAASFAGGRSWRWGGGFKLNNKTVGKVIDNDETFETSSASFIRNHNNNSHNEGGSSAARVKISRMRRKSSFFTQFSRTSSNLLGGIYESLKKQVVPWTDRGG